MGVVEYYPGNEMYESTSWRVDEAEKWAYSLRCQMDGIEEVVPGAWVPLPRDKTTYSKLLRVIE